VGSIRKSASLGSWLHGVAHRTSLKARAQSAARHELVLRSPVWTLHMRSIRSRPHAQIVLPLGE
jgi:hypothetical protein